ncbi:unnamed protein product [Prorocentrum cordatum]|uniref:Integrase catalytic domain-containing protein n=1 Tax=Prorocentrum cordatum TaxID=2364126 RepID=A0ABN9V6E8_9DINO|nr:unnamed protein product [Polarella glacialis]
MPGAAAAASTPAADIPIDSNKHRNIKKDKDLDGGSGPQRARGDRQRRQTDPERWGKRTIGEWMRLDRRDLRLDWDRAESANEKDDRYSGKPCYGEHDTTHPLSRHANGYKVSYKCVRCELVMLYIPKHGATGKYRQRGALSPTVGKIKIEEITKEKVTKEKATSERESRTKVEEVSSEDSFEKAGESEEEETPYPGTDQMSKADLMFEQMRDSFKRRADPPTRRKKKESPQGGEPEGDDDVITFGIDVEYHKEEINLKDYSWVLEQVTEAGMATDLYLKQLIEFCTEEDSQLGKVAEERKDAEIIRITRKDADLSTKNGLEFAKNLAVKNPGADIWGSLQCTAASALHHGYIGRQDGQYWKKLEARKKNLKKIVNHFMQVSRIVKDNGGDVHFEWPRNCHGWKYFPELTAFFDELSMEKVNFDGCQVGVVNTKGEPIHKPWTQWTSRKKLATALSGKRCPDPRGHGHAECCGKDATLSGRYPARMARIIWRNIVEPPKLMGLANDNKEMFDHEKELELTSDEQQQWNDLPALKQNELMKAAMRLHRNTAVKQIKCSSCIENQIPSPRPAAVLEPARDLWQVVGTDVKETVSNDQIKRKYLVIVDEASKLTLAVKIFSVPAQESRNCTAKELLDAFRGHWSDRYGMPSVLRLDPEGAFVSHEFYDSIAGEGVQVDPCATQAHWQNGIAERAIKTVFECAKAMHRDHETELEAAVHAAVEAHNTVERVDGYSPSQWAFGRDKNWSGTLKKEDHLDVMKCTNQSYMENLSKRVLASKIIGERILKQQQVISVDKEDVPMNEETYVPETTARAPEDGFRSKPEKTTMERITVIKYEDGSEETVKDDNWNVHGKSTRSIGRRWTGRTYLFPIADKPEEMKVDQNDKEVIHEEAKKTVVEQVPETHEDNEKDQPSMDDIESEKVKTTKHTTAGEADLRRRIVEKRKVKNDLFEKTKRRVRMRTNFGPALRRYCAFFNGKLADCDQLDWDKLDWEDFDVAAWAAAEIQEDLEIPTGTDYIEVAFEAFDETSMNKFTKQPEQYITKAMKKGRSEASVKHMTDEQKSLMKGAKLVEVRDWIANNVLEKLPPHIRPKPSDVLKTRWVLTWKKDEATGGSRAKARLVVLGYQDPRLGEEPVASPTMTRRARNMIFQLTAMKKWKLKKGDVKAAFLQGKGMPDDKPTYIEANDELAEEFGVPGGTAVRLKKAVYGLCQAPKSWYESVDTLMEQLGGQRCVSDPCVWVFSGENDNVFGVVGTHVDDFLIAGDGGVRWRDIEVKLQKAFRWTPWEEGSFKQTGLSVMQTASGEITIHQKEFIDNITEINISQERRKQRDQKLTDKEMTMLRGALGEIQWVATQTMPKYQAQCSIFQSSGPMATVETLFGINKLIRQMKNDQGYKLKFESFEGAGVVAGWSDAAWANRPDGLSTGGYVIGIAPEDILNWKRTPVGWVSHRSGKLQRVARSSLAAEVQALTVTEDELFMVRMMWAELNGFVSDVAMGTASERKTTKPMLVGVKQVRSCLCVDAKSIYDCLAKQVQMQSLAEKRTALELMAFEKCINETELIVRW